VAERPEPTSRRRYAELVARVGRGMFPRTADFRALLGDQAEVAVEALQALAEYAATGEVDAGERVAAVEKRGDRLRERNLATLNRAFTTTYDRDLTAVAIRRIDDVANYAKTTVREMGLLAMEPDATVRAIAELLSAGAVELRAAVAGLGGDPRLVEVHVVRVHKAERRVEKIYRAAFAELFAADARARWRSGDPIDGLLEALRHREVYRHLSNAADRLDGAGAAIMDIAVATA
jgi:uncharacterized protein